MKILLLKKFNNYFNRIIVKYSTLDDYKQRSSSFLAYSNVNFNPNDGVTTELVVGNEAQQVSNQPLDWEDSGNPDYLVCYETELVDTSKVDVIKSRWFITDSVRTRNGQYKLTLKRDVIADHLNAVEDATCFIEKGIVEDADDSGIYNKEQITTNQIKSDEFLLKDETQCGWIVGYVAKDRDDGAGQLVPTTFTEQTIPGPEATDDACDEIYANEDEFYIAHPECVGDLATLNSWAATVKVDIFYGKLFTYYKTGQTITCYNTGNVSYKESAFENNNYLHAVAQGPSTMIWKAWIGDWRNILAKNFVSGYKSQTFRDGILQQIASRDGVTFTSESQMQAFFNFVKREPVIKIGDKYYKPYDRYGDMGAKSTITDQSFISLGSTAYDLFYDGLDLTPAGIDGNDNIQGTPGAETFKLEWSYNRHALGLREIFSECKAKIPASVPVLKDAPYHMFAIPFSDNLALYEGDTLKCVTNKSVAMNAAQALAQQAGVGVVYDVQLLPYCPIRDIIKTTKETGHAEFPLAEENLIEVVIPHGSRPSIASYNYFKLNTQYVLSKNIVWTQGTGAVLRNQYGYGLRSNGAIYVKVGETDLENPTNIYQCKNITVIKSNNEASEDAKIRLYSVKEPTESDTPIVEFSYNSYVSGDTLIGIYLTSDFEQGGYGESLLDGSVNWEWMSNTGLPLTTINARHSNPRRWTTGYIFYEDYYLTKIDVSNAITSNIVTTLNGQESEIVNMIFWCTDSQFSFNKYLDNYFLLDKDGGYIQDKITDLINEKVKLGSTVKDIKVRNQVDMLRLAAPNYSNFFDINVQRNKGIEYINVDCTYKPYQPYLHLNPNFKGLYGADYNDIRGLICGGDYSIATTTDAWATYQLQNKNYQAVFDRQIQQLEVAQSIQQQNDIVNAITGVGTGAVGGALVGAKVGGGYGAIAGAIVGAGASAIGGMGDVMNNQRMRELQISTMKDIYGYNLENIKALPLGLSKTSYLTNNNKLFPFLEFYTCTPIEEQAVRDLIDYNGMTINRVGKIKDFQSVEELPYIKAKLIRIDIEEDTHQVRAIADELETGVYIPEGE